MRLLIFLVVQRRAAPLTNRHLTEVRCLSYQLALVRPGTSPRMPYSRSLIRESSNLRRTPWGRPVTWQRLRRRDGEASRGSCWSFICASQRSSSLVFGFLIIALSSARFAANFATVCSRFSSRFFIETLAITLVPLFLERKAESFQQLATFVVGTGTGGNGDIQPADLVDFVVLDLREDDLLTHTHAVVTAPVKGLGIKTTEVTNTGNRNVNQAIKEIPHTLTAQGNFTTDRPSFTDFETRNGLTRCSNNHFLSCQAL